MLDRNPEGQFISRKSALLVWLPELIKKAAGDPVVAILECAGRYAGHELQRRIDWQNDLHFDLWTRRWRFLRKALADWQAIK